MSKKDRAFELFGKGKTPDDDEVVALGLARESTKRYYRLWKQPNQKPVATATIVLPVAVPSGVLLSGIPNGSLFEYRGQTYKRQHAVYSGQVIVLPMHRAHYTTLFRQAGESAYLPPNIMVTLK